MLNNYDQSWTGCDVIARAVRSMTNVAMSINEVMREHERSIKVKEIQRSLRDWSGGVGGDVLPTLGELVVEVRTFFSLR